MSHLQENPDALKHLVAIVKAWPSEPFKLHLRAIDPKRPGEGGSATSALFDRDELPKAVDWAARRNGEGFNVYYSPNPIDRSSNRPAAKDEDVAAGVWYFADFDQPGDDVRFKAWVDAGGIKPNIMVVTGTKPYRRFQAFWSVGTPQAADDWNEQIDKVIGTLDSDKPVRNLSRVMRLAGFKSYPSEKKKEKGYQIEQVRALLHGDRSFTADQIATAFPTPSDSLPAKQRSPEQRQAQEKAKAAGAPASGNPLKGVRPRAPQTEDLHLIHEALRHVSSNTDRATWRSLLCAIHDAYAGSHEGLAVAQWWSQAHGYADYDPAAIEREWHGIQPAAGGGASYKKIFALAQESGWSQAQAKYRATPAPDANDTAEQTHDGAPSGPNVASGPRLVNPAGSLMGSRMIRFADEDTALSTDYMIKGVMDSEAVTMIFGPSNVGKTFVAMNMAYHIAAGKEWAGQRVRQAPVLYVAAEGHGGLAQRIAAMRAYHDVRDVPLYFLKYSLNLGDAAQIEEFTTIAGEICEVNQTDRIMIFLDTMAVTLGGLNENDAETASLIMSVLGSVRDQTGASFSILHHIGKQNTGPRGSSAWRAAVDSAIEVVEDEEGAKSLKFDKQRDHGKADQFDFDLELITLGKDDDGDEIRVPVAVFDNDIGRAQVGPRHPKLPKNAGSRHRRLDRAFRELMAAGRGMSIPRGTFTPEYSTHQCLKIDDVIAGALAISVTDGDDGQPTKFDKQNMKNSLQQLVDRGHFSISEGVVWRPYLKD